MISREIAKKVVETVDKGLSSGVGNPVPGQMCVEAAICYAMGLPHGDNPTCVNAALRSFKIGLNDANWSSKAARAHGMRKLAILQLGTDKCFDEGEFVKRLVLFTIKTLLPTTLRLVANLPTLSGHKVALEVTAKACEVAVDLNAARYAASDAASAASDAASDARYAASAGRAARYAASDAASAARYAASAGRAARYAASDAASAARYAVSDAARCAARYAASDAASAARYAASAASGAASDAASDARYAASAARYAASDAASDGILHKMAEGVSQILIDMSVLGVSFLDLL